MNKKDNNNVFSKWLKEGIEYQLAHNFAELE